MSVAYAVGSAVSSASVGESSTDLRDVTTLVEGAVAGDQRAWAELVARFAPLVRAVTGRFRLSPDDVEDVSQFVWLRLFEQLRRIREPRALPGWIATTARNEALRTARAASRTAAVDPISAFWRDNPDSSAGPEDTLLRTERRRAARLALSSLRSEHRELLLLLHSDRQFPYSEVGKRMHMPVGSIGPTRSRCLEKLRATAAIRNLGSAS